MNRIIYTSIDNFKLKNWEVRFYKELTENFVDWIEETTCKLFQKRNNVELKASELLKEKFAVVYEQPYFMIRGRSYFLDFYLPEHKIAIEIDGVCHKYRRVEDKQRDSNFRSIGINTIRIDAKDVFNGTFLDAFEKKFFKENIVNKSVKHKHKHHKRQKELNMIKAARKRLREHDRMKHNAKWI